MRTIKIFNMQFQSTKEDQILHLLRILNTELRSEFDKKLQSFGLTGQQGRIMFYMNYREEKDEIVHQNDIEKTFSLSKSTVSGLVSRLENKGFITKKAVPPYVDLKLTSKGKNLVETFKNGRSEVRKKLFKDISKEDRASLLNIVEKLVSNIKLSGNMSSTKNSKN